MDSTPPGVIGRSDRFSIVPVAMALAVAMFTLIVPDFVPDIFRGSTSATTKNVIDLNNFDVAFIGIGLALLIGLLIALGFALVGKRFKSMISHGIGAILVVVLVLHFRDIIESLQMAKMLVFQHQFDVCPNFAIKYSENGAFNICSIRGHGNSFLSMVYDSGGEIKLSASQQSLAFKNFMNTQIGPLFTECDVYSRNVSGSFYLVRSDCG
jgi:hypothetical protein